MFGLLFDLKRQLMLDNNSKRDDSIHYGNKVEVAFTGSDVKNV